MKKGDSFVDNVATVFIALSVISSLFYLMMLGMDLWVDGFSFMSQSKILEQMNPFTRWFYSHLAFYCSLELLFELVFLVSAIGLLKRLHWGYRVFQWVLGIALMEGLGSIFLSIYDYFWYPFKGENGSFALSPIFKYGTYGIGLFWKLGVIGVLVWIFVRMRRKEIRKLF